MSKQTNSRKTNGQAGTHGRPNGNAPASTERGGIPAPGCTGRHRGQAASDDASGASVASAASSAAAGADHEACAAAAPPPPNGAAHPKSPKECANTKKGKNQREIPPGEHPLPDDPAEFVQEIHRKIDLTKVWHRLLRTKDPKIKQRAVEKLTEMLYKGAASLADEPSQVVIDIDSAAARRAAEGAKK